MTCQRRCVLAGCEEICEEKDDRTNLECSWARDHSLGMSTKEIEFEVVVRKGLVEIDRGERVPIEEIEAELPSWVIE